MCCNVNVFIILIGFEEGRGFLCWTGSCLQTAASWPNCVVFTKFKTFWLHYKNVAWGILNHMLFYNLGQNSWKIKPLRAEEHFLLSRQNVNQNSLISCLRWPPELNMFCNLFNFCTNFYVESNSIPFSIIFLAYHKTTLGKCNWTLKRTCASCQARLTFIILVSLALLIPRSPLVSSMLHKPRKSSWPSWETFCLVQILQ